MFLNLNQIWKINYSKKEKNQKLINKETLYYSKKMNNKNQRYLNNQKI